MALNPLVKFTQGVTFGVAGRAMLGDVDVDVLIESGDNLTGPPTHWKFVCIDAPPAGAMVAGILQDWSATPNFTFSPDVEGWCWLFRIGLQRRSGTTVLEEAWSKPLAFGVLDTEGMLRPPFGGTAQSMNFAGQTRGYAPYLEAWLDRIAGGLPAMINTAGAVIVEDPGNTRISRRLRDSDIDPDFAIASWAKTAPNGGQLLYRRGDTVTGIAAAASYLSGPPDSASVAHVLGGSTAVGDIDPGAWSTMVAPFDVASLAGSLKRSGADGGADPYMTVTLTAAQGLLVVYGAWTLTFCGDIYLGVFSAGTLAGTDVFTGDALQNGFTSSLQTTRSFTHTFTPTGTQYFYALVPNRAPYTSGTILVFDTVTGFGFNMSVIGTTPITRNGVVQTYAIIRSDNAQTSAFTLAMS